MVSGVTTNSITGTSNGELDYSKDYGTDYAMCAFALGGVGGSRSGYSVNQYGATAQVVNCTFTFGYWKNHPEAWGSVTSLTLGTVTYTKAQLLQILSTQVVGNGLVSLAHQLIAAKLNILVNGADPTAVSATIAAADAQIGSLVVPPIGSGYLAPADTETKTQILDDYNNGITGPGHCGDTPARETTWGRIKTLYR